MKKNPTPTLDNLITDFYESKSLYENKCKECLKLNDCNKCPYKINYEKKEAKAKKALVKAKRILFVYDD